ncbi:hypothetical protein [Hufsiella ginkgonis]|uniref:Uncharacterized protein n=1 Tax=Hufsiella ginkgonis TaxID=2695274 RepID=A0A7K1Y3L6_9SPHI|nr:hypothetical protein [Hufsiella ginkgonis]MXV17883.1 hypothetical protein [Hufsiella ginkgonis]
MKKSLLFAAAGLAGVFLFAGINRTEVSPNGFVTGTPEIRSVSALTFGPDGILFVGDSKSAAVFAIDTKDTKRTDKPQPTDIRAFDQKLADALGTTKENVTILDMVVNPISKKIYFAVQTADGSPALLKLEGDKLQAVPMNDVRFSSVALNNVAAEDAKDARGRSLRVSTISDIGYADGKLLVSGLSNKEFSSSFRSIPFPFTGKQDDASLEMYHASHGRFETTSPIRTFTTGELNGKKYLIASYTCTPLVVFPLDELTAGAHIKGRTVAEMGNGNTPVDMVRLSGGGNSFLVLANDRRPVAKVNYKNIEQFEGTLTERVAGTAGVTFAVLPLEKVVQLDKLDDSRAIVLQKRATGELDLWTSNGQNL